MLTKLPTSLNLLPLRYCALIMLVITGLFSMSGQAQTSEQNQNTESTSTTDNNANTNTNTNTNNNAEAGDSNAGLPIDLVADKGSFDQLAGIAVYEGNVRITQGVATLWADKVTIYLTNNAVDRMVATGKPAKFEYQGDEQPILGQGNSIEYIILEKQVTLKENAVVTQGDDEIRGVELTYDIDQEIIGGSRVEMTLQPRQSE